MSPGSVLDTPSLSAVVHNGDMTDYALTAVIDRDFDTTVADVRAALGDQGFGIITEIDMAATLQSKLGVEIDRQVILGACNPGFAHRALQAEPSMGLLLPCNVVVRSTPDGTVVEMIDPATMTALTGSPEIGALADEVKDRLSAALAAVAG
jgi:uncharacterized protein (DUF302 family)